MNLRRAASRDPIVCGADGVNRLILVLVAKVALLRAPPCPLMRVRCDKADDRPMNAVNRQLQRRRTMTHVHFANHLALLTALPSATAR
jgi:hypothetical protein